MKKLVKITDVRVNNNNPRFIKDNKFRQLVESIKSFPEMLEKRPIIVDENMVALGGNMRLRASQEVGLKEVWIDQVEGWTEKQKNEFIIKDNVGFGEWDWDVLANEWDSEELKEWGLDIDGFEDDEGGVKKESYKIEITLEDEEAQDKTYTELLKKGLSCKKK